jgi:crossover junction endodeoxyribonuclease RuvC
MPRYPTRSWRAYRPDAPRAAPAVVAPAAAAHCTILGLDPGSHRTGYGVVVWGGAEWCHVAHGRIDASSESLADRLRQIFEGVQQLVAVHRPDEIAVERVFVNRNVDSALKLGQARGAALSAVATGMPVFEYAPRVVKMAIVGFGGAQKPQVGHMVKALLKLDGKLSPDASDALAVALCHAHTRRRLQIENLGA